MTRTIISLTTIPPRMAQLGPTLDSLLMQTAPIDAIQLWVPRAYRRKGMGEIHLPDLPPGIELHRCAVDYGPATKILPAVQAMRGQDVRIIYCDDDRIFHPDWAGRLIAESDRYPRDCICEAGERIEATALRAYGHSLTYAILAKLSLGIHGHLHRREIRALDPGHGLVDIAKGYGGVLVRPDFLAEAAFDIPDTHWVVDDIWLSGHMALNGIRIRKVARRENSSKTSVAGVAALVDLVSGGKDRDAANLACIRHFRETHGIWGVPGR